MKNQSTTPKPFCFVLMPFSENFADVYQIGIKEACVAAGAYCERVDEQIFSERILDRIYNQISKADFIVADMTGRNANVFYEVGYAHALGKRTILLTKNADDIPFDLKHFPHIVYGERLTVLRDELTKRVVWHIENPPNLETRACTELELYHREKLLRNGDTIPFLIARGEDIPITIHNNSLRTFGPDEIRVGVILSKPFYGNYGTKFVTEAELPDGRKLFTIMGLPTLFPSAYHEFPLSLYYLKKDSDPGKKVPLVIRIFSAAGAQDYNLEVELI